MKDKILKELIKNKLVIKKFRKVYLNKETPQKDLLVVQKIILGLNYKITDINELDLQKKGRQQSRYMPRVFACFLCKKIFPESSLYFIGRVVGRKDHSLVIRMLDRHANVISVRTTNSEEVIYRTWYFAFLDAWKEFEACQAP